MKIASRRFAPLVQFSRQSLRAGITG